ncbi:MAG: 2-dehydropantoate 2-reductase N-terminal domain-containing protein [Microthrixaceae bacterium]
MPFENGLGAGDRVARHIDRDQIVIGIAEGFGSSIPAPGSVHHNGMRLIRIAEMSAVSPNGSSASSSRGVRQAST